jgi:hypothetical protein
MPSPLPRWDRRRDLSLPGNLRRRPSPWCGRVGSHIVLFEACSAFTRVTAYLLAGPLFTVLSIEGFSDLVASTAAPIATGWSESCRVGIAPTEDKHLCTAHHTNARQCTPFWLRAHQRTASDLTCTPTVHIKCAAFWQPARESARPARRLDALPSPAPELGNEMLL